MNYFDFACALGLKEPVALYSESESSSEGFQLLEAESAPFVAVVPEDTDEAEEDLGFGVVLGGVPCPRSCRIKELGNDEGICGNVLAADFLELLTEVVCE